MVQKVIRRSGIHSVLRHGEAASSNKKEVEKLKKEFSDIKAEGFVPQQVFDGDKTGLFWNMLPNRTFIRQEEKAFRVINLSKTG